MDAEITAALNTAAAMVATLVRFDGNGRWSDTSPLATEATELLNALIKYVEQGKPIRSPESRIVFHSMLTHWCRISDQLIVGQPPSMYIQEIEASPTCPFLVEALIRVMQSIQPINLVEWVTDATEIMLQAVALWLKEEVPRTPDTCCCGEKAVYDAYMKRENIAPDHFWAEMKDWVLDVYDGLAGAFVDLCITRYKDQQEWAEIRAQRRARGEADNDNEFLEEGIDADRAARILLAYLEARADPDFRLPIMEIYAKHPELYRALVAEGHYAVTPESYALYLAQEAEGDAAPGGEGEGEEVGDGDEHEE